MTSNESAVSGCGSAFGVALVWRGQLEGLDACSKEGFQRFPEAPIIQLNAEFPS